MSVSTQRNDTSRRAVMAKKRQSRRPSRLGEAAGVTPIPDRVYDPTAGFPGLLARVWQTAATQSLPAAVETLLTLDNHVPADIQLRALRLSDEIALKVLFGRTWRPGSTPEVRLAAEDESPAFLGEIGLTKGGRIVLRVPSAAPLGAEEDLVDGVLRVPWSRQALIAYRDELGAARERLTRSFEDCREWLAGEGDAGRDDLLTQLEEAALRTAPFVLYQEDKRYTNFRERNTLTGKTLWPGHPDCALGSLRGVPLEVWSDSDVTMVVCLTLLVRSASFARIEEANGTQLTLDHVAELLERTRGKYNSVATGDPIPEAASNRVSSLMELALALRTRRQEFGSGVQLYREIHGPLMHKIERVAGARTRVAEEREEAVCARLRQRLPVVGDSLADLEKSVLASPAWLARPHGEFATGLEALIYESVAAATEVFEADFAMSRGLRSLPVLIRALREDDWESITEWELPEFFCCVVPSDQAQRHFDGSRSRVADAAWSMSARMQYNSWHFIAGNLPKVPEVLARDHFVPPTIPDIAYFSDQHHHGHVAAKVRFSIRSPQAVEVLGRRFTGFLDVRLLRCAGTPFTEHDLLAVHRVSHFVAAATTAAATMVAEGADITVEAFDSQWHWSTITATADVHSG